MMKKGLAETKDQIGPIMRESFNHGPSAVSAAEDRIGNMVVAHVRPHTPVRSGRLRDSFKPGVA